MLFKQLFNWGYIMQFGEWEYFITNEYKIYLHALFCYIATEIKLL